jgi:hypothetical protein
LSRPELHPFALHAHRGWGQMNLFSPSIDQCEAVAEITRQQGRIMQGVYKSKYATENFLATIGYDNKSFFLVDEDGFADGPIIDGNQIQVVYRHTTDLDSVIDLSSWTWR